MNTTEMNRQSADPETRQGQARISELRGLLSVKEAAAWLAISPATCYRLMERGTLRSIKIGGARRIRLTDLQSLIAEER
jgi:excisionase family DNA binding protein